MCLLERVLEWDAAEIVCCTERHRDASNPLRRHGTLSALHVIEFGAQAVAAHGALLAREDAMSAPRRGVLASVRDLELAVDLLDDLPGELLIRARRLLGDRRGLLYEFTAHASGRFIGRGRVGIVFAESALGAA